MIESLDGDNTKFIAYGSAHIAIELRCTINTNNLWSYAR
jgi:hypothetical protein